MIIVISGIIGIITGVIISKITSSKVSFTEVENKDKKPTSDDSYFLLEVKNEKYLFTKEQIKVAKSRAEKNPEDVNG
jgi:hypothetical protein